ncbi:unnamed protein product [Owenia fusiformis]|uniref:UBC core domain-containing protein n=1 Tax=Owenia fusiformis TaxID=6347 RepID=A0A8S4MZ15_OWEFU|nr:unnamed protein product [Owenia fusiformis]
MAVKEDTNILVQEFEKWQEATNSETIFLLESSVQDDGGGLLHMLLGSEHEFKLLCPPGYPSHDEHFYIEVDTPPITLWGNALNEYLLDAPDRLLLQDVLNKASSLYINDSHQNNTGQSEDEMSVDDDDDEDDNEEMISDDDSAFTTEWELQVARKKKRWAQKEAEVREEMKRAKLVPGSSDYGAIQASGHEKEQAGQIFTTNAASGILTNDLVKIMEVEESVGFTADPIDDNIYKWSVKLYNFAETCDLGKDLAEVNKLFGYNNIELEMDFAIDLYPFYPPLVKVIRPRLQGSMMQRVTNMEMLKLSYWNPAKDMKGVLSDIKNFLQQWARLEVNSERNDPKRFPTGSYVEIEHHLLRLALVSEVNPRANIKYHIDVEKPPELRPARHENASMHDDEKSYTQNEDSVTNPKDLKRRKDEPEYWAKGVGYGHSRRPEWDVKAYLAAQREKDKQVEDVLHKIQQELKVLYANHAPQLKPRKLASAAASRPECVDPVEDMYNILEGSALVPFLEQYLKADSFLEICRHTAVYKVIVDIIKEVAMQPQLVPLLCTLPDQKASLYQLLETIESQASGLLARICKAGNGSIPKPPKRKVSGKKEASQKERSGSPEVSTSTNMAEMHENSAEEKLAREFVNLFQDVTGAIKRSGNSFSSSSSSSQSSDTDMSSTPLLKHNTADKLSELEANYRMALKDLLFDSVEISTEGSNAHHYLGDFKKSPTPSQSQVFRIAQEITSLSTSLPIDLSSSIFVRTDDDKLTLMKAMITGPEGTPYSGGCFTFDIFFPFAYPKAPPLVNLQTTGGGTVRFNPNLYNCGKVCLSLLGTWEGQQGETWNEITSTLLQVLVSIQSLILVPEPYFNEPGYEQEIGTDAGKRHSAEYNADVRTNTIKWGMINQLQNPSEGFSDVIKSHFYLKKDRILEEVEGWVRRSKSSKLERVVQNLKTELNKLQPPPNLANLCSSAGLPRQQKIK